MRVVQLLSIDIGTTTCCAVVYDAQLESHSVTGKMQLQSARIAYQSAIEFTPFYNAKLDSAALYAMVHTWLQQAGIQAEDVYAGGVIITGLSAELANARAVAKTIQSILGNSLLHTVNDPNLEAWLAYKGCISPTIPQRVLNLDIGGGTTNVALGEGASVLATGCYNIGARHFQFAPGTYRLVKLSDTAEKILKHLQLYYRVGDSLSDDAVKAIVNFYVAQLRNIALNQPVLPFLIDVPLEQASACEALNVSGGVGLLLAQCQRCDAPPPPTAYGDLGGEIAHALAQCTDLPPLLKDNDDHHHLHRATALGLALHNTEVTSDTIFYSHEVEFPLPEIPLLGELNSASDEAHVHDLLTLQLRIGGAVYLNWPLHELKLIKLYAHKIQDIISRYDSDRLLVYLLKDDAAASFGNYLSGWRQLNLKLLVMDNIPNRKAAFVQVGAAAHNVHPVSYFGIQSGE